jgi:hypothetical protein
MGDEMAYATQVIREAFLDYEFVLGRDGNYGGGRAPRDRTLSFRLRDRWGNLPVERHLGEAGKSVGHHRGLGPKASAGTSHKSRSRRP